jgi:hypothetical protein
MVLISQCTGNNNGWASLPSFEATGISGILPCLENTANKEDKYGQSRIQKKIQIHICYGQERPNISSDALMMGICP